ncbi:ABC transporter permease subunit [Ornithinimicrobium sufpigmenti]|uniref:ABC transporter permease subunit n=1 Tax=Ornithinimicrobium sufpigmenti TaxID=2508882 RepID=UPI0010363CEB|nr:MULTISPECIES: ABC transporter permease subunit [unclassified Ornithinimicrobium]
MTRLVRVELRRIMARRVLVLALLAAAVVSLMAVFGVHQLSVSLNQQRAGAQEMLEEARDYWEPASPEDYQVCVRDQARARQESGQGDVDFGCEQLRRPPILDDFLPTYPSMDEQYRELLGYLVYPFLFLALAVGSTSVAAEFTHRTMGSWLTFLPRRAPVFSAKVVAAALVGVPIAVVGLGLVLVGVPAVLRYHGIDDGLSGEQWVDLGWMAVRIVGLAAAAAAFGAGAAFLVRHSAVVLGLMVGYLVLAEGILRGLFPSSTPWLLGTNLEAFVEHGTTWTRWPDFCDDITVSCTPTTHVVSFTQAAVVLAAVLALTLGLALLRFMRSDFE